MHDAAEEINNHGFSPSKRNLDSRRPADNYVAFISLRYSRELISRRKRWENKGPLFPRWLFNGIQLPRGSYVLRGYRALMPTVHLTAPTFRVSELCMYMIYKTTVWI